MSSVDRREPDALERETLLAYEAPPPPADMADRVLAALRTEVRPRMSRRTRWMLLVASLAVAATAVALLLPRDGAGRASSGHRAAGARESIAIGDRAVAVAEAGSELSWTVQADGAAAVDQRRGDVFYRVTPGQEFVVAVPGASIRVLGTCFRVEVSEMRPRNKILAAGGIAAALTVAVLVTVYEGRVRLENGQGEAELVPGEQGTAAAGTPPVREPLAAGAAAGDRRTSKSALEARVRDLENKLRRAEKMLGDGQAPVILSSPAEQQFAAEQRDPSWAPGQEQRIQERLTRFVGLERGSATVECRRTCCQIALDAEDLTRVLDDLQSDAGLKHLEGTGGGTMWLAGGKEGVDRVSLCLQPDEDVQPSATRPDRGEEREALLLASRPAVEECMRGAATAIDFEMTLAIDPGGEIVDVTSKTDPVGHPAATCLEQALLSAARLAPSTRPTSFAVRLHLDPLR